MPANQVPNFRDFLNGTFGRGFTLQTTDDAISNWLSTTTDNANYWLTPGLTTVSTTIVPGAGVAAPAKERKRTAREILDDERDAVASLLAKLEMPGASTPSVGEMPEGYLDLVKRLGMEGPALVRARVLSMLQREELVVYPLDKVMSYLGNMCQVLTEIAKPNHPAGWGHAAGVVWRWKTLPCGAFHTPKDSMTNYDQIVPVEALRIMDRVLGAMPDAGLNPKEFSWLVSEVSEYPDPFLSLAHLGDKALSGNQWVLFHWDEPGFSILK